MNNSVFKLSLFFLISFLLLSPTVIILFKGLSSLNTSGNLYASRYILGSAKLVFLVSFIVVLISVPLAWVNTMTNFWGRRVIQVFCIFPLGVPAYISAYAYAELLEPGGYLSLLFFSYEGFSLRNNFFGSLILSLSLFPYVYLLTRIAIINFSARYIEAAKTMGKGPFECFLRVCLPMALPGIAAGLALALMETINDFGVADFFGLQTLTLGVFQYISIINDLPSAFLLSLIILIMMIALYVFEQSVRGKKQFHNSSFENVEWSRYQLGKLKGALVLFLGGLPIIFGFIIPLFFTFYLFLSHIDKLDYSNYLSSLSNSFLVGSCVGLLCIFISIFINFYSRFSKKLWVIYYKKIINLGYALPGVVISLGVLILLSNFSKISSFSFSATAFGLILALVIRLIAISNNSIDSGLEKVGKSIDDASRLIGRRPSTTYFRVIIPQVRLSILAGFLLVFVDTVKELPITLLLRPFNFNTLATSLYEYSSNEMFEYGSLHALTIIIFLSFVIYLFDRAIENKLVSKIKR